MKLSRTQKKQIKRMLSKQRHDMETDANSAWESFTKTAKLLRTAVTNQERRIAHLEQINGVLGK
jgi:hypothetical protein